MNENFFSIKNLCITRAGKILYKNFSLAIEAKKITSLLSPSGSGKTTLFYFIAELLKNSDVQCSGEIFFSKNQNENVQKQKARVSFLFQENRLLEECSVFKNIFLPLANCFSKNEAKERANFFLENVFLFHKKNKKVRELSGGEKRRLSLARSLAFPSELLLLDEPFFSQDSQTKKNLMLFVKKIASEESRTVFFSTHNVDEAVFLSDRIIGLHKNPLEVLFDEKVFAENKNEVHKKILKVLKLY